MYKKSKFIIGSMMLVMMVILLGLPTPAVNAVASTYYVAITGFDTNPGTSSFPFRNIQQCASVMVAGDTCLIQSGTYREIITPTNSGSSGLPITFRADTNATVVVSGTTPISGWTQYAGNIYMANFSGSLGVENQLFVNNGSTVTPLWEARWPNISEYTLPGLRNGMAIMQSGSSTSIVDSNLSQADGFWNGATVWQRGGNGYLAQTTTVTNFVASSHTLTLNAIPGNASYLEPSAGSTYYLSGVLGALDAANEWYVDSAAGKVYLWAPYGGVPTNVEVKQRVRAFELSNKSYIHITGIQTFAANIQMNNSNYNVLDGITAQHLYFSDLSQGYFPANQDDSGITIVGNNNEIKNSTIAYSTGTLIKIAGDNNRIVNNNIHDGDYMSSYAALIVLQSGNQNLISRNTVRDSGRTNIYWKKGSAVIEYNNIYNGMWISTDGGLLYTYGADLGNSVIHHNLIHDNKSELTGSLLYFDNFTENAVVHHNVIYNSGLNKVGIQLNTPGNFKLLYNNTVVNNGSSTSNWGAAPYSQESYGTRVFNNIFTNQLTLTADTVSDYNTTSSAGLNFVNAAANNYRLLSGSTAINAGAIIPGITNGYSSSAPDVGAYEYGGADWTAGHDFTNPPNPVYSTVNTAYMNLLKNSAFELGMVNWTKTGAMLATNVAVPTTPAWQYRGYISKLRLGTGIDGVTQTITGLQPNTGYKFVGWVYNDADEQVNIGVKDYGGSDTSVLSVDTQYVRKEINFTTGAANTSATVYITKTKTGTGYSYGDDFGLFETTAFNSGLNDSASLKDVLLTTPIITYTVGDSGNLTLTGTLRNGANAGLSSAVYTSSNPSVASIDSVTGTVATITARAGGQTTITGTVTIGGITKADAKVITVFPVQSGSSVADWTVRQYGANAKGFVEENNGSYSLLGKGDNVWGTDDDFVFLSKTIKPVNATSKITLTATINSFNSSNTNTTIGLMFRDKDTTSSKHVHFRYEGTGALRYVYRNNATNAQSGYLPILDKYITYPVKLKLVKEGNTVTGYYQNKGAEWRIMGSVTCEFTSNNLLAGVGMYSGSGLTPVMADISDMEVVEYGNNALDIVPTASATATINFPSRITDGVTVLTANEYASVTGKQVPPDSLQWIQIDLGQSYNLDKIKLWHYFLDGRTYKDVIAQVSNVPDFSTKTTVFNNDTNNSAGQGTGGDNEYAESSSGKEITFSTTNARYVRLWTNGNTVNSQNNYVEVEVWGSRPMPVYKNLSQNTLLTASAAIVGSSRVTDGVTTSGASDFAYINTAGPQWIQINLGQSYNMDKIKLWHYYADGRTYKDVIAQVSNVPDFSTKTTVFNNDTNNSALQGTGGDAEYVELSSGKEISFSPTNARYVRLWTNGSTANTANHYVEVEVWGSVPKPEYKNWALNRVPTTSATINFPSRITDGVTVLTANEYATITPDGPQWIQLDLGQSYNLDKIKLWHYYTGGRTYQDVIAQVSNVANFSTPTLNVALNKKASAIGSNCGNSILPANAVDGSSATKWCHSAAGDKWLMLDLGQSYTIERWVVKHSGVAESAIYNTRDFKLQKSDNGTIWTDVDSVTGNTANITDRSIPSFSSRYTRLYITNSGSDNGARIYELELYSSSINTKFNNDVNNSALQGTGGDNEYAESSSGKEITFSNTNGRYVRLWTNGSTANTQNNYVEVEVWGSDATATFVGKDTTTQGNWVGKYGADGYNVQGGTTSYPSYATVSVNGALSNTYANPTTDVRGLKKSFTDSTRVAAVWYSTTNFTYDVNLADNLTHRVSLYNIDWDNMGRIQKVEVLNAAGDKVLDTQNISSFTNGTYLTWNITGHVKFRVTFIGATPATNATVAGIFFK